MPTLTTPEGLRMARPTTAPPEQHCDLDHQREDEVLCHEPETLYALQAEPVGPIVLGDPFFARPHASAIEMNRALEWARTKPVGRTSSWSRPK